MFALKEWSLEWNPHSCTKPIPLFALGLKQRNYNTFAITIPSSDGITIPSQNLRNEDSPLYLIFFNT